MLYIINRSRLIKPVNNEVGQDDNKAGRGSTDYAFVLGKDWRIPSYVAAVPRGLDPGNDDVLVSARCPSANLSSDGLLKRGLNCTESLFPFSLLLL